MRHAILALLLLVVQSCAAAPVRECDVLVIGWGNYALLGSQIVASQSGAGFDSDPAYLVDGKPGTLTNAHWSTVGATTDYVGIQFYPAPTGADTPEAVPIGVMAILNTDLPEGMLVQAYVNGVLAATSQMQSTPASSRTSAWFVFDEIVNYPVQIRIYDNVNGATVMSSGQEFTVGEVFAAAKSEWCIKRNPRFGYAGTNKMRISSTGVQWPVLTPVIRNLSVNLAPIKQKEAFTRETPWNLTRVLRSIFESDCVAFIPFTNYDPAVYGPQGGARLQPELVAQTAWVGQLTAAPTITGNGQTGYDVQIQAQEAI